MSHEDDPHHFDFDLDRGIREQVVERLEASPFLRLVPGVGPRASGVYALYYKEDLAYIGKVSRGTTKSERTLRERLGEHRRKLVERQIALDDIRCRYLTFVSEWWVFAAEFALITYYRPLWNGSGYGSKTPGVGRPGTDYVSPWNVQFPKAQSANLEDFSTES